MNTAISEVDLNPPFGLKIFRVELHLLVLLLSSCLNKKRIAQVVIVQMKRCLIVAVPVRRHGLTVGDPGVLYQDLHAGTAFTVGAAHEPFDRKPMIRFVRGPKDGGVQE